MFDWIVRDIFQYLELFNFVDICQIELLGKELFDHLTVCIYKMYLPINYISDIYVKTKFGIE